MQLRSALGNMSTRRSREVECARRKPRQKPLMHRFGLPRLRHAGTWVSFIVLSMLTLACTASEYSVEIDLQEQRAYLLRNRRVVLDSPISSGRAKYRTPTGSFRITEKDMDHRSTLYGKIVDSRGRTLVSDADADMPVPRGAKFVNAPMHYFMRFTGAVGMHAGYLPGYPASHGCVRLPKERAAAFYNAVQIGSRVTV